MAQFSPITGVGLGNYYNYVEKRPFYTATNKDYKKIISLTINHPHNSFFASLAETGIGGLISYIALIGYFLLRDMKVFFRQEVNLSLSAYIASFWLLFAISLSTPSFDLTYTFHFWLLRGLIYTSKV